MARTSRNDPCPCGSGKKFKRCCGAAEGRRREAAAQVPVYRRVQLPAIHTQEDLGAYLDAYISSFNLFSLPRTEALLHTCRAVEVSHLDTVSEAPPDLVEPFAMSVRNSQDLLRYLLFEIENRCPAGGRFRPTTMPELVLARLTARQFISLSHLRDARHACSLGWGRMEIESGAHRARFHPDALGLVDPQREREHLKSDKQRAGVGLTATDSQRLRGALRQLRDSSHCEAGTAEVRYEISTEVFATFFEAMTSLSGRFLRSGLLPDEWSLGASSLGTYHAFYHVLQVLCAIRTMVLRDMVERVGMARIAYNSATLILTSRELLEGVNLVTAGREEEVTQIIRDLTYRPSEVQWTEVTYQPLLPLPDGRYAVIPVVVDGSNFDRNLLALLGRLPWRRQAADELKRHREGEMIRQIEPRLQSQGWSVRATVPLGDKRQRVGDVDVLAWSGNSPVALALSLKWFYGPDSVQEVGEHSKRYREALTRSRGGSATGPSAGHRSRRSAA